MKELILIIILGLIIIYVIVNNKKKVTKKNINIENTGSSPDNPEEIRKKFHIVSGRNYIIPKKFNIGLISQPTYTSMNNCNHNVLYPINAIDVDYGSKMPSYCPCMQFIQAP